MSAFLPRFRGIAFEENGKWGWEILVTEMGKGDEGETFHHKPIFETKEKAIIDLNKSVQEMIKIFAETTGMAVNINNYIDMKTNETRKWDKSDLQ